MGSAAWITAEGIDLVLTTRRTQVFHPEGFAKLGLDLTPAPDRYCQIDSTFPRRLCTDREGDSLCCCARRAAA
jgi:hypothetical protein